jgi:hypothetical protein
MRIKYLGAKALIVLTTTLATPVVWAALAWPEWSSASPADEAAIEQPAPPEAGVLIQRVVHEVVVLPNYVYIEATPASVVSQAPASAPAPVNTPAPAPTAPPATPTQVAVLPSPTRPVPALVPQTVASSGGSGNTGSTSTTSSSSSSSSSSGPQPSKSKTRGS